MNSPVPRLCSVIIPAYNVEGYVSEAIESALAQTYPYIEVVVVNDGSTDGTEKMIEPYLDRIVYVKQDNQGLAATRNVAVRVASGEYIALLDADDVYTPHRITECIDYLERHLEVAAVTTDAEIVYGSATSEETYYSTSRRGFRPFDEADQLGQMLDGNYMWVAAVIRTDALSSARGFDGSLRRCEDYDLWLRILLGGGLLGIIPKPLGIYRRRAGQLTSDSTAQRDTHFAVLAKYPEAFFGRERGRSGIAWEVAKRLEGQGMARQAARFYLIASRDAAVPLLRRLRMRRRWLYLIFQSVPRQVRRGLGARHDLLGSLHQRSSDARTIR